MSDDHADDCRDVMNLHEQLTPLLERFQRRAEELRATGNEHLEHSWARADSHGEAYGVMWCISELHQHLSETMLSGLKKGADDAT